MLNKLKLAFIALFCCFLVACQSNNFNGSSFDELTLSQRQEQLLNITELKQRGRLAVISRLNNRRMSISYDFNYKNGAYSLELLTMVGMSIGKLEVQKNGSTFLTTSDGVFKGESPRELIKEQFNLDVPVEDLYNILIGLPKGDVSYDAKDYPLRAQKDDEYLVNYDSYLTTGMGYKLPSRLEIVNAISKVIISVNNVDKAF